MPANSTVSVILSVPFFQLAFLQIGFFLAGMEAMSYNLGVSFSVVQVVVPKVWPVFNEGRLHLMSGGAPW